MHGNNASPSISMFHTSRTYCSVENFHYSIHDTWLPCNPCFYSSFRLWTAKFARSRHVVAFVFWIADLTLLGPIDDTFVPRCVCKCVRSLDFEEILSYKISCDLSQLCSQPIRLFCGPLEFDGIVHHCEIFTLNSPRLQSPERANHWEQCFMLSHSQNSRLNVTWYQIKLHACVHILSLLLCPGTVFIFIAVERCAHTKSSVRRDCNTVHTVWPPTTGV